MESPRIAIIGSVNRDIIISDTGSTHESLGGILYNLLALAELGQRILSIIPITFIGSDAKEELYQMLGSRTSISLHGIRDFSGNTNMNRLVYSNKNERKETASFYTPPISLQMITPYLDCDVLLFNFIAGYDVSLQTLKAIRAKTHATIFMDVHSLVLAKNAKGVRAFHPVQQWKIWTAQTDILQMNTGELLFFTGNNGRIDENDESALRNLIAQLVELGPRFVIITASKRGIYLGTRKRTAFLSQKYTGSVVDTTGCGDIFSAAFLAKLLIMDDPSIACDYANTLAGLATQTRGIKKCFGLKHFSPLCTVPYPPIQSQRPCTR